MKCGEDDVLRYEQHFLGVLQPEFNTEKLADSSLGTRRTEAQIARLRERPQSTAVLHEFRGEMLPVREIARRLGVTPAAVYTRLRGGGTIEPRVTECFTAPVDVGGEALTPKQIAQQFDLPLTTVYSRLKRGWVGVSLTQPRKHRARNSRG